MITALIPNVRRLKEHRDILQRERNELAVELRAARGQNEKLSQYLDSTASVIRYRQAFYSAYGRVASGDALPSARAWPNSGVGVTYGQKMLGMLPTRTGRGAELGPLNTPTASKAECDILYVDHMPTEEIKRKYPTVEGIVDIDRPIINNSISDTLRNDAPLDYFIASQVLEHVPNPIRWLRELASVLKVGGLVALSLPDRRETFDLLREETRASDIVAAYLADDTVPSARAVYDHHSLASFVNMPFASSESVTPAQVIDGRGAVHPKVATIEHLSFTERAKNGEYLDVHAWVFTPVSLLIALAQIAADGLLPFSLRQFYPTDPLAQDTGSFTFIFVIEKIAEGMPVKEVSRSYLQPLGA
jgi:hypothetical protein